MITPARGHAFQAQAPAITGFWRGLHFHRGAIAELHLHIGAFEGLLWSERNSGL